MARTLFDKIWSQHVVQDLGDGWFLLHIDRHLLHDLSGPPALADMRARGLSLHDPGLTFATADHAMSSAPGRTGQTFTPGSQLFSALHEGARTAGIRFFDLGQPGHGIVHVIGPEMGIVLPGLTVICGDSHTCTNGGLGALAFGVGSSESTHALATQTLRQRKPTQLRILCDGHLQTGVTAKDLALHLLAQLGSSAGVGSAIEFAGSAVRAMEIEERLTLCNLSIELGARCGLVAPDERTFDYLRGRPHAPQGEAFDAAVLQWRQLFTDEGASFDREVVVDATMVKPCITWGTSPAQTIPIDGRVPDPKATADAELRDAQHAAIEYMGLTPGQSIAGTPVDWIFIGSCTNSRISDLRAAAEVVRGKSVASGVQAWVVPGSESVKRAAEAEGLREIFTQAGFAWREPGCSMCVAANGEQVPPRKRCVSTSNRNFVGRQGPGARTHLASPAVAAASAILGVIAPPPYAK